MSRLSSMYLPIAVYEALPVLYALAGIATLLNLDNNLARLSGSLLIIVAFHVSYMRVVGRRAAARAARRGDTESAMLGMSWSHHYELNVPEMDREHEELFELSHELLDALVSGKPSEVNDCISELSQAVLAHFRNEERILNETGNPRAAMHAKLHRKLEKKLETLLKRYHAGKIERYAIAHFLMYEVVREHMITEDSAFLSGD